MISTIRDYPRKLNLGCGFDYRQGYLNVDFFNDLLADIKMPAAELSLPEDYFEEILLIDVIEHLGYCDSYFVLAQLHLLLTSPGTLLVSSPDLDRSLQQYVEAFACPQDKENILCWVYGTEDAGMSHKFCFPRDCLEQLLQKSGFTVERVTPEEREKFRPSLIYEAKKDEAGDYLRRNRLVVALQKAEFLRIEYTDLPYVDKLLGQFLDVQSALDLRKFVVDTSLVSPKAGLCMIDMEKERLVGVVGCEEVEQSRKTLADSAGVDYFSALPTLFPTFVEAVSCIKNTSFAELPKQSAKLRAFRSDFFTAENYSTFVAYCRALRRKEEYSGDGSWG
jgi:predicted SAM-dependent methyltransferase